MSRSSASTAGRRGWARPGGSASGADRLPDTCRGCPAPRRTGRPARRAGWWSGRPGHMAGVGRPVVAVGVIETAAVERRHLRQAPARHAADNQLVGPGHRAIPAHQAGVGAARRGFLEIGLRKGVPGNGAHRRDDLVAPGIAQLGPGVACLLQPGQVQLRIIISRAAPPRHQAGVRHRGRQRPTQRQRQARQTAAPPQSHDLAS